MVGGSTGFANRRILDITTNVLEFQPNYLAMPRRITPLGDTRPFAPDPLSPVRVRARALSADQHIEPHSHDWAQLAWSESGVTRVTVESPQPMTYLVPPSRAVWIPPGARHAVEILQAARLRTVYVDAARVPDGWNRSRVIRVSPLLRELIAALDASTPPPPGSTTRSQALTDLALDEMFRSTADTLGVPLPDPQTGDKRLIALCALVLRDPTAHTSLAALAHAVGASERTAARLFERDLHTRFQPWRQQVVLAHALPLLAGGMAVSQVAAACGYRSASAFSAMFRQAMGQAPLAFAHKV
jgi:AraC-like DNA-binding protein